MRDYGFLEDWPLPDPDHLDSWVLMKTLQMANFVDKGQVHVDPILACENVYCILMSIA